LQFVPLEGGEAIGAQTLVTIGLGDPLTDALVGGLELPDEFGDRAPGPIQFDDLALVLGCVRWSGSSHALDTSLEMKDTGVHESGSTPHDRSLTVVQRAG
jgi:hypothetical protein